MDYTSIMREAMRLAENAAGMDEVPVGARVMRGGTLLGSGHNSNIGDCDPTAHAEIVALRDACTYFGNYRLPGTTLVVTLEPCLMCFTAMIHARVETLVFGASDPKAGYRLFLGEAELAKLNHRMHIVPGVLAEENAELIRDFFRKKRERGKRKWLRNQT